MKLFPRHAAAALAATLLTLAVAGCQPGDGSGADKDATAGADAAAGDAAALKIEGLETRKEQVSYMIGMDIGRTMEPFKDKVDLDTVHRAMKTVLAGDKPLMTDEQVAQVREEFSRQLQSEQIAKMLETAKTNKAEGEAFLAANAKKPDVETTASGLQYQVLREGDGPKPEAGATVRVHYKGTLLDGTTFDSSYERNEPVVFALDQVVPGWQEGITLMPVGSKYRFWIPGELGYGERGTPGGPIGPNATLVFEVELLDIVEPPAG